MRNRLDVYSMSRLLEDFDKQIISDYLKGLDKKTILNVGRIKFSLNNLKGLMMKEKN